MQIEIKDELVDRIRELLKYPHFRPVKADLEEEIVQMIEKAVAEEEKQLPQEQKMFRIKTWIPVEIDPEEDMQCITRDDAEKEKAQLEEMQPENRYEIEEVERVFPEDIEVLEKAGEI